MAKTPPFSLCNEFCVGGGGASNAKDVKYDNKTSGLKADNVGGAIDEICTKMNDIDTAKDWNQNDPKKADYIKNRPFYDDGTKVKQLEEKFIPDTIARTEDVDKKMEDAEANVADKIAESLVPFDELKIKNKASGTLLALPDSAEAPLQSMKIYGKTTQFTTTGKNKLPYPYKTFVDNKSGKHETLGITFINNGDGSVYVKGTSTGYAGLVFTVTNVLEDGKTYYLPNYSWGRIYCRYNDADGKTKYGFSAFTWSSEYTFLQLYLQIDENITVDEIVYPIIVEGTSYDGIWEPYTGGIPSPNPDYPQELVSVGDSGSTTEYVMGKNLFGGTALRDKILSGIPSATIDETNETIEYHSKDARLVELVELSFKEKTRYTIVLSGLNTGELYDYCNMLIYYTDGSTQQMRFGAIKTHVKVAIVTATEKTVQKICGQYASDSTILYYNECGIFEGVRTLDDFEPYKSQTLTIPTPNGLPGVPVSSGGNYTDSNGQQYVCDYKDYERNVYVQRVVKTVLDGSADESWIASNDVGTKNRYFMLVTGELYYAIDNACVCTHYKQTSIGSSSDVIGLNSFNSVAYNRSQISIRPNNYIDMTTTAFRKLLAENPITVYYALTTPIETPLTEEEIQAYKALHTNYPNTTIYNSDGAGAEVEYVADTKNYIDNKIEKSVAELTAAIITE